MPDIVEERGQHDLIVVPFGQGQLGSLGHVLDLRNGLANVVGIAMALVQGEDFIDDLRGGSIHQVLSCYWSVSPSNRAT
ncbi:hypothetical protein D3C72_2467510 [compost metagenome]